MPGKVLGSQAQQFVINLLSYFEEEKVNEGPLISITQVRLRVAAALKISSNTVSRIKKKHRENPILTSPNKKRIRQKLKSEDICETQKMEVRDAIYNMHSKRQHITLTTLQNELREKQIIEIGRTSLYGLLKSCGFSYRKDDNRRALCEKNHVAAMRAVFLRKYMENLESPLPYPVVFLDETWIFAKGREF